MFCNWIAFARLACRSCRNRIRRASWHSGFARLSIAAAIWYFPLASGGKSASDGPRDPRWQTIKVDTLHATVVSVSYTWHRLKAGLLGCPGAEHQNSYWVSGNKPHPPREVGAVRLLPPVFIWGRHAWLSPAAGLQTAQSGVFL